MAELNEPQAADKVSRITSPGRTSAHDLTPPSALVRLEARARQKEAVARLSLIAMSGRDVPQLLDEACRVTASTLRVEYCKLLKLIPERERLLLCAGVGWNEGYVGQAIMETDLESQAGYTLLSRRSIIVEDLSEETRFNESSLLHEHGVTSGMTAVIGSEDGYFGVLGAHSRTRRSFTGHEVQFLEDVADLLGIAIERYQKERQTLKTAVAQLAKAEASKQRCEYLAGAIALLSSSSTDYTATLRNTVRLVVPTLATWCFVDIVEPGGDIRRAAVGSATGTLSQSSEILKEPGRKYPMNPNLPHGTAKVLNTGRSELLEEAEDIVLETIALDPEDLTLLRRLAPCSYLCVPLRTSRGWTGAIGFVSSESGGHGKRYGEEDLILAEGLAHCVALALDNAASHLPEVEMAREIIRRSGASESEMVVKYSPSDLTGSLTRRQLEVLGLMAEGKIARQIGRHLSISEDTVRNHIRAIKYALDAGSQLEAIAQARRLGVLPK